MCKFEFHITSARLGAICSDEDDDDDDDDDTSCKATEAIRCWFVLL